MIAQGVRHVPPRVDTLGLRGEGRETGHRIVLFA